ncbi:uncharacterized protein B0H64DRAFT_330444 [Chaetomium fimeti]|uniref:F-box domain-containing protein n=1 Tax=Chaetomium fimeti TaxID=1854472 RepID=A0AAE0H7Q6_9PEZI|nr:hypothetical protein B0H64DRAFT_330444 [Chaetomium fimeti]
MGSFDMYCAICGCSLGWGGKIGSKSPAALNRRRARIARIRAARERGEPDPGTDSDEKEEQENGNETDDEVWHSADEDHSHDPSGSLWLAESYCLAINPQAQGHPNYSFTGPVAFPFHPCCFSILTDVLAGSTDVTTIDKDALYSAMCELVTPYASCLRINYGDINGRDQTWVSIPGEEVSRFSVAHPGTTPEMAEVLVACVADEMFQMRPDSLGITREVRVQDPFAALPPEILPNIFRFLPGDALLALLKASWVAFCTTRHNSFWKWFLKHDMPWLIELRRLLEDPRRGPEPNYKVLYMWLNELTTPSFGMDSPLTGLANRRRIWSVCEELAPRYFRQLQVPLQQTPDDSMLQRAHCRHLVFVSGAREPQGESWSFQRTLFVYSQDEIKNKLFSFSAYWAEDSRLAGLCVMVGKQKRTFGLTDNDMPDLTKTVMCLAMGDCIKEITLLFVTTDPNKDMAASPRVVGLQVRRCPHPETTELARDPSPAPISVS